MHMQKKITNRIKTVVKKIIWKIHGGYKAQEFWDRWSKTFMDDPWQREIHPQHVWIKDTIDRNNPKTVLEVGCGFGRNIQFLIDNGYKPNNITGIDISPEMIKKAKKYMKTNGVRLKTASVTTIPFDDSQFDITLSHGVLMHVPPRDIHQALNEIIRVSNKGIVLVEQNYDGNEYTFIHNYKKLLHQKQLHVVEYKNSKKLGLDLIYVEIRK